MRYFILLCSVVLISCSANKKVARSGKVTPKRDFKVGMSYSYNVPLATAEALSGSIIDALKSVGDEDSLEVDQTLNNWTESMTIFALDPLGVNADLYINYGIAEAWDIGFAYSSGANYYEVFHQFMGPTGEIGSDSKEDTYGSVGLRYSSQSFEMPSYLGDLQKVLGYDLERKDLLIPLVFSTGFGPEEKYGAWSYGAALGWTSITYNYNPKGLYEVSGAEIKPLEEVPQGDNSFFSYGAFSNVKFGYQHFYLTLGLSCYYQDYGEYNLFQGHKAEFSGLTFIPSLGLELAF